MKTLSLDSQVGPASLASLWAEVERTIGYAGDPLEILIAEEEEQTGGCSFPQCYIPCRNCKSKNS